MTKKDTPKTRLKGHSDNATVTVTYGLLKQMLSVAWNRETSMSPGDYIEYIANIYGDELTIQDNVDDPEEYHYAGTFNTPLITLGLSKRTLHALVRCTYLEKGKVKVGDIAKLPDITKVRGFGAKGMEELLSCCEQKNITIPPEWETAFTKQDKS